MNKPEKKKDRTKKIESERSRVFFSFSFLLRFSSCVKHSFQQGLCLHTTGLTLIQEDVQKCTFYICYYRYLPISKIKLNGLWKGYKTNNTRFSAIIVKLVEEEKILFCVVILSNSWFCISSDDERYLRKSMALIGVTNQRRESSMAIRIIEAAYSYSPWNCRG